jgi:hypothetical protein
MGGTAGSGCPPFGTIAPAPPQMLKKNTTAGSKLGIPSRDALIHADFGSHEYMFLIRDRSTQSLAVAGTCSFFIEFLTDQTTCASELLKKTPSEKFCQKGPAVGGGTPAAGNTWHLPPLASPAGPCRRWHRRHVRPPSSRVTWPNGGGGMPPCR